MGKMISMGDWARKNGIDPSTARQRAGRGVFKTAEKIAGNWIIDEDEPLIDHRYAGKKTYKETVSEMGLIEVVNAVEVYKGITLKSMLFKTSSDDTRYHKRCDAFIGDRNIAVAKTKKELKELIDAGYIRGE